MPFQARFVAPNRTPPARLYWHSAGSRMIFGDNADRAKAYVAEVLDEQRESLNHFNYLLGAVWGDSLPVNEDKVLDLFGYNGIRDWPGNPDVHAYVFRNGVPSFRNPITCGDTTIVLGLEEHYRIQTKDLGEFMSNPPMLGEFEPPQTLEL